MFIIHVVNVCYRQVQQLGSLLPALSGVAILIVSTAAVPRARSGSHFPADTLPVKDTVPPGDSIAYKLSDSKLDAPVYYKAKDSMVLIVPEKRVHLYGKANTQYKEIKLDAGHITYEQRSGIMEAAPGKDTAGKKMELPVMDQGGQSFESDTLRYHLGSQRAKIYNTRAQYGEAFVMSRESKRQQGGDIFGFGNAFTTCNLDTPHFQFRARKIKVIPDKLIISGAANLEIEGIPTPIFIPFAIFPITHGQRSGILPPEFVTSQQKGVGLENGGYYLGLGEHFDLTVRGSVYSYGSWTLNASPTYRQRYKYNGGLTINVANTLVGGDPKIPAEFTRSRDFRVTWNHAMDSKARPGVNFGAQVNFGTSSYNKFNVTDYAGHVNNTMNSSINFSKTWQGKPFNLTMSMNHSQVTTTRDVNITFPDGSFTVNTIYPFQPKELTGVTKWYHKIGLSYNAQFRNRVEFKDSMFLKPGMFDRWQAGVQHSIPISFSIPVFKNFTFTPGISYNEYWYSRKTIFKWNDSTSRIDTSSVIGFYTAREVSFSASVTTTVDGRYTFRKGSRIKAIRHLVRPSISTNYKPDLAAAYYQNVQYNKQGATQRISYFPNSVIGVPSEGTFGGINFQIDNNLEMKVASKKDTSARKEKKIKILDGFGITGNYNLIADSFKLGTFGVYARSTLFDKLNISANGTIDPYVINEQGIRQDRYVWQAGKFSLGRLTNASIAVSTSFQSGDSKSKKKQAEIDQLAGAQPTDAAFAAQQQQLQKVRNNPGEYADFDIPWRLDISYSLTYSKQFNVLAGGLVSSFVQYLSFNGDINITPKWKLGLTSGIDFIKKQIAYTTMYITRDLHDFNLAINLVPYGFVRQFSISITAKSGLLRDLRINRTRQFYDL